MVGTINVSPAEERGRERGEGGWFRLQKNVLGVVVADHMHRMAAIQALSHSSLSGDWLQLAMFWQGTWQRWLPHIPSKLTSKSLFRCRTRSRCRHPHSLPLL